MRERGEEEEVGNTVVGLGDSKAKQSESYCGLFGCPFSFLLLTFPSSSLVGVA